MTTFVRTIYNESKEMSTQEMIQSARSSRKLVLVIVFIALFLDNMLLTTVVPVIPNLLTSQDYPDAFNTQPEINITRLSPEDAANPRVKQLFENCKSVIKRKDMFNNISDQIWGMSYMPKVKLSIEVPPCLSPSNFSAVITELGKQRRHSALVNENVKVGIMFASKAVVQLFTNPIIGPLTNKIGYTIPMFTGFVILTFSTTSNYLI